MPKTARVTAEIIREISTNYQSNADKIIKTFINIILNCHKPDLILMMAITDLAKLDFELFKRTVIALVEKLIRTKRPEFAGMVAMTASRIFELPEYLEMSLEELNYLKRYLTIIEDEETISTASKVIEQLVNYYFD